MEILAYVVLGMIATVILQELWRFHRSLTPPDGGYAAGYDFAEQQIENGASVDDIEEMVDEARPLFSAGALDSAYGRDRRDTPDLGRICE